MAMTGGKIESQPVLNGSIVRSPQMSKIELIIVTKDDCIGVAVA